MNESMKFLFYQALISILATIPGIIIACATYIKAAASAIQSRQAKDESREAKEASFKNREAIEVVHRTINSNREADMAMAQAGGQARGIMMERDAALAAASASAKETAKEHHHAGTSGVVAVKVAPGFEVTEDKG